MDSALRFPLNEVKESGEMAVKAAVPPDAFADALTEGVLVGPVAVEGVIRRVDDDAVFEGKAAGRWRFECTRCLTPVDGAWSEPVEMTVPVEGAPMDLTDEVRQSIALAQPMKIVCKPDCKGLCPACRANRNDKDCGHVSAEPDVSRRPRLTRRPEKG